MIKISIRVKRRKKKHDLPTKSEIPLPPTTRLDLRKLRDNPCEQKTVEKNETNFLLAAIFLNFNTLKRNKFSLLHLSTTEHEI